MNFEQVERRSKVRASLTRSSAISLVEGRQARKLPELLERLSAPGPARSSAGSTWPGACDLEPGQGTTHEAIHSTIRLWRLSFMCPFWG